jgi:hypothetical protein
MTPPGGRRRALERRAFPTRAVVAHALSIVVAVVAWWWLVRGAIDFGVAAREGDGQAWAFLALASVGAIGCLLLALVLAGRLLVLLGVISSYTPKRARRER